MFGGLGRFGALGGKNATIGETVYPAKDFYLADFTGIANATTLRSLPGWSAYNSTSSTNAKRDQW